MGPLIIVLFLAQGGWAAQCDKDSGPSGATGCVQIQNYNNQYQWTTCLTNAYIQQKSDHMHTCVDRSETYCLYQCMLEMHNKTSGPVSEDCSCQSVNSTSNPYNLSPTTSLPSECYSPCGDSCDWYRNCLEKKYPCEATSNAYAIRYAETFCKLYDKRFSSFSQDAQKWINGVRKCLQVVLVPLLRPWTKPTCQGIRQKAFASHTPCYMHPGKDVPSVCDLGCWQYFKIFWTIKGSFTALDTAWESIKGMWNIGTKCGVSSQVHKCLVGRKADAQSRFADGVGSAIASALKWNTDVMDWMAHPDSGTKPEDSKTSHIIMVLADKKPWTIQEFGLAVEEGRLLLNVHGSKVWVKSLATCSDKSCDNTQTLAVFRQTSKMGGYHGKQ
ncbi:hypothetical protein OS493_037385 [Desmophyllum pertusum]|uniref:Uncharacterized protein n=1 Tax=Desmophyllum pertusum TaxID=174260 RepID=A0A9W9ZVW4_9CNID|nr:hypothetical protein OS493_037385 [Desmophyllum pertusum]